MNKFKNVLYNPNLTIFLLAVFYFIFTLYHPTQYTINYSKESYLFIFIQIICFIVIIFGAYGIKFILQKLIEKDKEYLTYAKYFLAFFILQIFLIWITKPFAISGDSYLMIISDLIDNSIIYWYSNISNYYTAVSNSIFMSIYGAPIMSAILYSLVFVYFINIVKNYISKRFWWICLPLFIMPHTLLWNLVQYRTIYAAWILLFILAFLYRSNKECRKIEKSNYITSIILGILCAILTVIRSENIFLLFTLPFVIIFIKIFSKKELFVFCIAFLFIVISIYADNYLNAKNVTNEYQLHNLSFTFQYYIKNNIPISEYYRYKDDFLAVLPKIDKYISDDANFWDINDINDININSKSNKIVKKCLLKMTLKEAINLGKIHLDGTMHNISFDEVLIFNKQIFYYITHDIKEINSYSCKYNKLRLITALQCNNYKNYVSIKRKYYNFLAQKVFYNTYLHIILLLISGIYGIITRKKFYISAFIILCSIYIPLIVFMPFGCFSYIYSLVFCTWALFYMITIEIIEKIMNSITKK